MTHVEEKTGEVKKTRGTLRRQRRPVATLELGEQVLLLMMNQQLRRPHLYSAAGGYLEDMLDLDPALSREEYHAWVNGLINGAYLQRGSLPPTVALTEAGVNAVYHLDTDEARWAVVERFLEQRGRSTMVQPVHDPASTPVSLPSMA